MRAIKLARPGGLNNLTVVGIEPRPPGPDEIQVRIEASSLNFHDYAVVSGMLKVADGRIGLKYIPVASA